MKTLIVDDDYITRRLMQMILLPYGKCELAGNGRDALIEFIDRNLGLICSTRIKQKRSGLNTLI